VSLVPLTGGSEGTGTPDVVAAVETLDVIDNVLLVNVPGLSDTTKLTSIISWAATALNRFIVVDAPKPTSGDDSTDVTTDATNFIQALPTSSFAAVYGPWVYSQDPGSSVAGSTRLTAPGGAVLGQYARNDVLRGVQKVPAGTSTSIKAVAPYVRFTNTQLDSLNQMAYNVLRTVPGVGLCIMGGRTLDTSTAGKYINVRRTLMYLERSIASLTRFAIFENNDSSTWDTIEAVVAQFLTAFWQSGGLRGDTAAQAFFVTCDATNNLPSDIQAGNVNVDVGVSLETPAEFIVIRIGQFDGTTIVTETDTTDESA
jgi:phage tail sheath protein FI